MLAVFLTLNKLEVNRISTSKGSQLEWSLLASYLFFEGPVKNSCRSNIVMYDDCSNMNASSFITFFNICYNKMINVSIKDYMSPLNWHQT